MKNIFKKSNLPFIGRFADKTASPRDHWTLARYMQDEDGFTSNDATVILLLQRGAMDGDPWSMCELARSYFAQKDDVWLPMALHWWHRAIRRGDKGALWDAENLPVYNRMLRYRGVQSQYGNMEMQCAMLTDWILLRLGRDDWRALSFTEQKNRAEALINVSSSLLGIAAPATMVQAGYTLNGAEADGAAYPAENELWIRQECFDDLHRLIQVIFHELGHFVTFSLWDGASAERKECFGLTDARIESWKNGTMGLEVPTIEEDPDTFSYGVYTTWMLYFDN